MSTRPPDEDPSAVSLERRAAPRVSGSLRVVFDSEGAQGSGMTSDLSVGGLLLTTRSALHAGVEVKGEIQLPEGRPARFVAAVRWMRPIRASDLGSKRLLVGLKFVPPTPPELADFLNRRFGAVADGLAAAPTPRPASPTPRVDQKTPPLRTPPPQPVDDSLVFEHDAAAGGQWRSLPPLAACLLEAGCLDDDRVTVLLEHARRWSCSVIDALRQLDLVPENDVARAVAHRYALRIVDLSRLVVPRTVTRHLSAEIARRFGLAPLRIDATGRRGVLHIALFDPETIALLGNIEAMVGTSLHPWVTTRSAVQTLIADLYG